MLTPAVDFDLSDDQVALRDAARELLDARSSTERVRKLIASDDLYDAELWRDMAEQGWLALDVAEDDGGLGLGFVESALLAEEVGRHVSPAPYLSTVLARQALAGTEWAQRLSSGEAIGAIAWRDGLLVDAAIAAVLVVVRDDGVSVHELATKPAAEAAMDLTRPVSKVADMGAGQLVGDASLATAMLDRAATAYAAEMLGAAQRMLEATVEYAKVREQFGRPIGSFQAVKHRCADMLVDVEGMRSAVWYAAWAVDTAADDRQLAASTAKAWASDAGMRVLNSALQVHGGIGFTWEHDLHLYLKRAQLDALTFGDATYHRERIAGLLKARVDTGTGIF